MDVRFPDAKFIGNAHVSGSLYDLGAYPGLLLDEPKSSIRGEVYGVNDDNSQAAGSVRASSDYLRKQVDIASDTGKLKGWVYVPAGGPDFY